MANEDKKDFNAMLHKDTGMPKIQIITDKAAIKNMAVKNVFAPPLTYDEIMKAVPFGKVLTVEQSGNISPIRTRRILPIR